jgi:uncharacterized tellurite resistance protein B-like protein
MKTGAFENRNDKTHKYPHFASLVYLAHVDGSLHQEEEKMLLEFAKRLDISKEDYKNIMANPMQCPVKRVSNSEARLRRIFDMFRVVFADYDFDDRERIFVYKYALQLGFSKTNVRKVVNRSIAMFTGKFDFEDYANFIRR